MSVPVTPVWMVEHVWIMLMVSVVAVGRDTKEVAVKKVSIYVAGQNEIQVKMKFLCSLP